ncbi:hypothetical protein [Streptomyces sp. SID3343]|uniref:hypothetical protein n=1 Tax=Streptomyces sp. SID3343 TaxID=2690260 RepID=UPI00136E892D|nr:hypothetical protein [Streptomyces sp. SID3343]MYW05133.1 hypothetical protein [Streptomyces sp. SID3343]
MRFPDGASPQLRELATRLEPGLDPDGLADMVLYDHDVAKIALAARAPAEGEPDADEPEFGTWHERTGRQLYYLLCELEPELAELRSGALIRTVVQMPDRAVFYYLIESGTHLYGSTSRTDRLEEVDRQVADLVNRVRRSVKYSPLNYGAYSSTRRDAAWIVDAGEEEGSEDESGSFRRLRAEEVVEAPATRVQSAPVDAAGLFWSLDDGPESSRRSGAMAAALAIVGLHYVALHRPDGRPGPSVDLLDHADLDPFFTITDRERRRARYRRIGELLPGVVEQMNRSLLALTDGELVRLVLDVEQGALYFHALPDGCYLVGVTLDQEQVAEADARMARLGDALSTETG